jgi:dolichyl-phosphate-mannose-protein mannosyltransferase
MAEKNAAVASGADTVGDAARRRNVPGSAVSGSVIAQPQPDEKKIHGAKKVRERLLDTAASFWLIYSSQSPSILEILDEWEFIIAPLIFTAFAVFTRLWKIGLSPIVTWDVRSRLCCLLLLLLLLRNKQL